MDWIEGKTIVIEYRYARNRNDRLPELAAELVRLNVDVIAAAGTLAALAAKHATTTIPIVMTSAGDPIGNGLVASLARPGGNVTGFSLMMSDVSGKRLELLKELVPGLGVAVLWNSTNPYPTIVFKETQDAARTLGIEVQSLEVKGPADFATVFELARQKRPDAFFTIDDPHTQSTQSNFGLCGRKPIACDLRRSGICGGRRSHGLWREHSRPLPPCRNLRGQDLRGAKPGNFRSSSRPSLSWLSISRLLRRSGSLFRKPCLWPPTRWSNRRYFTALRHFKRLQFCLALVEIEI